MSKYPAKSKKQNFNKNRFIKAQIFKKLGIDSPLNQTLVTRFQDHDIMIGFDSDKVYVCPKSFDCHELDEDKSMSYEEFNDWLDAFLLHYEQK